MSFLIVQTNTHVVTQTTRLYRATQPHILKLNKYISIRRFPDPLHRPLYMSLVPDQDSPYNRVQCNHFCTPLVLGVCVCVVVTQWSIGVCVLW